MCLGCRYAIKEPQKVRLESMQERHERRGDDATATVLSEAEQKAQRMGKPLPSALAAAAGEARGEPPARSRAGAPAPGEPPPLAPALAAQAAGSGRLSPHAAFEQWARRKKDRQPSKGYGKSYSKGFKGRRGG